MYEEKRRLYVGNLPLGTKENDIKRKLKKYGEVLSVEVKQTNQGLSDHTYAFVDIQISSSSLKLCIEEYASKLWNGHQVKIQLAKESFLQRLEKERELSKTTVKEPHLKQYHSPTKVEYSGNGFGLKHDHPSSICKEEENSEPRDELPHNKKLPMFAGLKLLGVYSNTSTPTHPRINGDIENKHENEEQISMSKFESFSEVWKDSYNLNVSVTPNREKAKTDKCTNNVIETECLNPKEQLTCNEHAQKEGQVGLLRAKSKSMKVENCKFEVQKKQRVFPKQAAAYRETKTERHHNLKINKFHPKHDQAEEKRIKSLEERFQTILQKKKAISVALASVDRGVAFNKKIIFDDDSNDKKHHKGQNDATKRAEKNLGTEKDRILLFDDDSEGEELKHDFKIKKQYEGKKGQKLLELQSKYGNDRRFVLDERFYENDECPSDEDKTEIKTEDEKLQQLRVLSNVLGQDLSIVHSERSGHEKKVNSILRFDPSQAEHKKFEIVQEPKKKKKNVIHELQEESEKRTKDKLRRSSGVCQLHMPEVSKEKYYKVTDALKEGLQKQDSHKFSLLKLFGNDSDVEDGEPEEVYCLPSTNPGWSLNPFKYDSSDSESEISKPKKNEDISVAQSRSETFFFLKDDSRFQEGLEFIRCRNEDYINNFVTLRPELKTVVKKKICRWKRQNKMWRTKIGKKKC